MLAQYPNDTPLMMIWVGVEEVKRFALALYKVAYMCTAADMAESTDERLLTLADLSFGMPDSDELWNLPRGSDFQSHIRATAESSQGENRDCRNWISSSAAILHNSRVNFRWL